MVHLDHQTLAAGLFPLVDLVDCADRARRDSGHLEGSEHLCAGAVGEVGFDRGDELVAVADPVEVEAKRGGRRRSGLQPARIFSDRFASRDLHVSIGAAGTAIRGDLRMVVAGPLGDLVAVRPFRALEGVSTDDGREKRRAHHHSLPGPFSAGEGGGDAGGAMNAGEHVGDGYADPGGLPVRISGDRYQPCLTLSDLVVPGTVCGGSFSATASSGIGSDHRSSLPFTVGGAASKKSVPRPTFSCPRTSANTRATARSVSVNTRARRDRTR